MKYIVFFSVLIGSALSQASMLSRYVDSKRAYETNETEQARGLYATNYFNYATECALKTGDTNRSVLTRAAAFNSACAYIYSPGDIVSESNSVAVENALYSNSVRLLIDAKFDPLAVKAKRLATPLSRIHRFVIRNADSHTNEYAVFSEAVARLEVASLTRSNFRQAQNVPLVNENLLSILRLAFDHSKTNGLPQAAAVMENFRTNYPAEYGVVIAAIRKENKRQAGRPKTDDAP